MSTTSDTLTWNGVSERYAARPAPPGLQLTQALANSVALKEPRDTDPLEGLETAQAWLTTLIDQWVEIHGGPRPEVKLTKPGVARLRRLRESVRDALLRDPTAALRAPVEISMHGERLAIVPKGTDANWLESAISAELLLAQHADILRRLKLCRNPVCQVAFYDLSKNNSKVWHNLAICGSPQHMREYRARQRARANPAGRAGRPCQSGAHSL